jgi:hypothetical protein
MSDRVSVLPATQAENVESKLEREQRHRLETFKMHQRHRREIWELQKRHTSERNA